MTTILPGSDGGNCYLPRLGFINALHLFSLRLPQLHPIMLSVRRLSKHFGVGWWHTSKFDSVLVFFLIAELDLFDIGQGNSKGRCYEATELWLKAQKGGL